MSQIDYLGLRTMPGSVRTKILLDDNGIPKIHHLQVGRKASDRDGGGWGWGWEEAY